MHHFLGNLQPGFARQKQYPAPATLSHVGCIVARQADCAHYIDVEETLPFLIGDIKERFGFEDAEIVHQDVGIRHLLEQQCRAFLRTEIGGDALQTSGGEFVADLRQRLVDALLGAAVHQYRRSGLRQAEGDRQADAGGRTTHDCMFVT